MTENLMEKESALGERLKIWWALNLNLCDLINADKLSSIKLIRGIKKRIILKSPRVQYLALVLLETLVKNCEKAFSKVTAERVLNEMVRFIDDPLAVVNNRNKALMMIEAWGESTNELRYLPVYEETYKVLFPTLSLSLFPFILLGSEIVSGSATLDSPRGTQIANNASHCQCYFKI